jgi:hypothetical protein
MSDAGEWLEGFGASLQMWRDAASWAGRRTVAVSAPACPDAESGAALLERVCALLKAEGFEAIVGPMQGDTWGAYRLVTWSDGSPPFAMEPGSPPYVLAAFEAAGFSPIERYLSARRPLGGEPAAGDPPPGVRLAPFDIAKADADLGRIHAFSLEAFARNPFSRAISSDRFLASYTPVLPAIDPDLVLLAEDEAGTLQGFLFGIPNFAEGPHPSSVILKTYASRVKGLGSWLARSFHARAAEKGYRSAIHALMHEDNLSATHSANLGAEIFRRYALFGRLP